MRKLMELAPTAALLAAIGFGAVPAQADDASPAVFTFRGYGTLAVVHSSEDQADFLGGAVIDHGAGHTQSWSADVDSRVAAQLTAKFGSKLSAVVQVEAEQESEGKYAPNVEWANVKYQWTPDASIRVGRIVLPSFMVSDSRKVGYANPWVRPPVEVYSLVPITTSDGVDASYRTFLGGFRTTFQATYGQNDLELPAGGGKAHARDGWGIVAVTERGAASARASFLQGNLTIDSFNKLFDAFRQFGPEGAAIADRYDAEGAIFRFLAVGVLYDPGKWFVMAEWGTTKSASAVGDRDAWYVSGGYRFAKLTPYLTYSQGKAGSRTSDPGLTVAAYPPAVAGTAVALNAALDALLKLPVQSTIGAGVRWDFRKDFDLKLQFDHSRRGAGSPGTLGNLQPGFRPGGSYDLVTVAVDFVF